MEKKSFRGLVSLVLSFLLVLSTCFTMMPQEAKAAENVVFSITSDKTVLQRGDTFTVTVSMSGNQTAEGLVFDLIYDDTKLELQSSTKGELIKGVLDSLVEHPKTGAYNSIRALVVEAVGTSIQNGTLMSATFLVKDTASGFVDFSSAVQLNDGNIAPVAYSVTKPENLNISVQATGISLNKTSLVMGKGMTEKLKAVLEPADASEAITWNSDDPSVASVDAEGNVTAVSPGTARITAKAGMLEASCEVTVNIPLNGITIQSTASVIKKGQTAQLSVVYDPDDTTDDKTVIWSSEGEYASVDENGLVRALKDGVETITAQVGDKIASFDITVKELPLVSIQIDPAVTIHKGENMVLLVSYDPEDTTDDKQVIWKSSDPETVVVGADGTVNGIAVGQAVVTAIVGNHTSTCYVTVDAPLTEIVPVSSTLEVIKNQTGKIEYALSPADTTDNKTVTFASSDDTVLTIDEITGEWIAHKAGNADITLSGANGITAVVKAAVKEIPIDQVILDKQSVTLEKGQTIELTATVAPENTTDDDKNIVWSSSDESILSVRANAEDSAKAVVEAVSDSNGGKATITATAWNGTKAICEVIVPNHITSISLPENVIISRNATKILAVTYNPEDTTDDRTVTWSSSDPEIASVDENTGMITGMKAGKAEITATTKTIDIESGLPFIATTAIEIAENNLDETLGKKIIFNDLTEPVLKGQMLDLTLQWNLPDIVEENQITDDITVRWLSENEGVASVDQTGMLLGVNEGVTRITAVITAVDGNGNTREHAVSVEVEIIEIPLQSIAFDKVISEMKPGETTELKIIYNPENTTDLKEVVWSSSDESVLSVENGIVKALKAGTAEISAKVGDKTVVCKITVKESKESENVSTGSGKKDLNQEKNNKKAVKTGDMTNVTLCMLLLLASVLVLVISVRKRVHR